MVIKIHYVPTFVICVSQRAPEGREVAGLDLMEWGGGGDVQGGQQLASGHSSSQA